LILQDRSLHHYLVNLDKYLVSKAAELLQAPRKKQNKNLEILHCFLHNQSIRFLRAAHLPCFIHHQSIRLSRSAHLPQDPSHRLYKNLQLLPSFQLPIHLIHREFSHLARLDQDSQVQGETLQNLLGQIPIILLQANRQPQQDLQTHLDPNLYSGYNILYSLAKISRSQNLLHQALKKNQAITKKNSLSMVLSTQQV